MSLFQTPFKLIVASTLLATYKPSLGSNVGPLFGHALKQRQKMNLIQFFKYLSLSLLMQQIISTKSHMSFGLSTAP
jgi:hypothetical protein